MRNPFRKAFARPSRQGYSSIGWSRDSHPVHDLGSLIRRFGARPGTADVDAIEKKVRNALIERF